MAKNQDEEKAAARAVQGVIGGTWRLNDTGAEDGQFDVLHELDDNRRIALEVTSEGDYDTRKARRAIDKRTRRGELAGTSLAYLWNVTVAVDTRISDLRVAELEATLRDFEVRGLELATSRGATPRYGDQRRALSHGLASSRCCFGTASRRPVRRGSCSTRRGA